MISGGKIEVRWNRFKTLFMKITSPKFQFIKTRILALIPKIPENCWLNPEHILWLFCTIKKPYLEIRFFRTDHSCVC